MGASFSLSGDEALQRLPNNLRQLLFASCVTTLVIVIPSPDMRSEKYHAMTEGEGKEERRREKRRRESGMKGMRGREEKVEDGEEDSGNEREER